METISETFDGKVIKISNIEAAMVENVRNLLASNRERNVPLSKIKDMMANFNYKVEVVEDGPEVVTEAAEVGDVLITPEPEDPNTPVKTVKKTKKTKKAAKPAKKVKKVTKSKSVSSDKKRGRQPNLEKQDKAFKIIREMLSDGKEAKAIVKAGMKEFKCTYPAFYYYYRLYRELN